ncbi:FG-GAP-like repeat-containing protein, partial [Singulisphaera rosea]
ISAGASSLPGHVSFGGNFGTGGLVISDGALTNFDVVVATDIDLDGASLKADDLDLVYDETQDQFAIDGGPVTMTAKTGGTGISLSGEFATKNGLVIKDGSLQDLKITINDDIDVDGATLKTHDLDLDYDKARDLFAIDGGSVTISAGTLGTGLTLSGGFAKKNGLVIKDGSLQDLNITISGDISADGTSLKADGVAISFNQAKDQFEIVSGTVGFDFQADTTSSISGTFGSTVNGKKVPGLVIKGGQLESIDITINSQITVSSLAITVTNLDFQYNRSDQTFALSGSVSVAVGGGSPITATLVSPGLVIANSKVQSVDLTLNGKLSLFDLELDFQTLTVTYAAATANTPAEYTVTGGITIPELFDASVTLGSNGQDGLSIIGGQWEIGSFTISVADIPLGAFTIENLVVSYATGGSFSVGVTVMFPEGWEVGGCISFVGSKLDELSLSYSAGDGEGIEVGDTGLFVNWIAATVQNIDEPANLIVSGALGVVFGGSVTMGGTTATIFSATGSFTVDRDGLTLEANIAVGSTWTAPTAAACPIVGTPQPPPMPNGIYGDGTATISLDWSTKVYQVSAQFSMYDDVFSFSTTFTFRDLGHDNLAFSISAKADVNVPKGIPFIGGKTLGQLDFLFVYDSANFDNTGEPGGFVAAWVELDIIHKFDIGIEYNFSDDSHSFKVIGTSAVNSLNHQANSPAPQVYTYAYQFTIPGGATIAVAGLDWGVVDPTASLQITYPNGEVVAPGYGIPNGNGNTTFVSTAAALATPTSSVLQLVGSTTDETVALPGEGGTSTYTLTLTSNNNYTTLPVFTATYHYYQPTIAITGLSIPDPSQPNQVLITLDASVDSAFANATTISLFAVPQILGGSGAPIGGQSIISFTGTGQGITATWDMSDLYPLPYQIYARIDDTFNVPVLTPLSTATATPVFPITGTVSNPQNSQGISGTTVYLDTNNNGQYDPDTDPATTTGPSGFYAFTPSQVPNGTGQVGVVVPQGFATENALSTYDYVGQALVCDFSLTELASVSGTVYEDLNLNQQPDAGEPTVGGITVGLDANGNGLYDTGEPMAVTNNSGRYIFYNVLPNATPYSVILMLAQGVDFSTGAVTLLTKPILDPFQQEAGFNFYILPYTTVSGTIVGNVVANGELQPSSTNLAGWIVRLTYDNGGNSITTGTNSDGTYNFTSVLPGTYTIAVIPPTGWQQTSPVTPIPYFSQNSSYYPSTSTPIGLAVADFNNDGLLDFAANNSFSMGYSNSIDLYINGNNGAFVPSLDAVFTGFQQPSAELVAADIDGDGTPDLVAIDTYGQAEWLQNGGAVNFTVESPWGGISFGHPFSAVRMGPLNGSTSGADSVAFTYIDDDPFSPSMGIKVLVGGSSNNSTVTIPINFAPQQVMNAYGLACVDVNGDGFPDLVTSDANNLYVATGDGQGNFTLHTTPISSISSTSYTLGGALGVGDFNGDGRPDVAVATSQSPFSVVILLNQGALNWSVGPVLTIGSSSDSPQTEIQSLVVADFNGDILPDIALSPLQANRETTSYVDFFFNDDVEGPGPLADSPADQVREQVRRAADILAPVEREDLHRVAADLEVAPQQIIDDRDRPMRRDPDTRVGILVRLRLVEGSKPQSRELRPATGQDEPRVDPDQAVPPHIVGERTPQEARDDDHVIGAGEQTKPHPLPLLLVVDKPQVRELVLGQELLRLVGVGRLSLEECEAVGLFEHGLERAGLQDPLATLRRVDGQRDGHGTTSEGD